MLYGKAKVMFWLAIIFFTTELSCATKQHPQQQKIKSLIEQKKYSTATQEIRHYLYRSNGNEAIAATEYAYQQLLYFARITIQNNDDNNFEWDFDDLSRAVFDKILIYCPTKATDLIDRVLQLIYTKWPDATGNIIEFLFEKLDFRSLDSSRKNFAYLGELIDRYLQGATDAVLVINQVDFKYLAIHTILSSFCNSANSSSGEQKHCYAILFGQEYSTHFFAKEQFSLATFLSEHCDELKAHLKQEMEAAPEEVAEDKGYEANCHQYVNNLLHSDKELFIKKMMDGFAGQVASIALSTAVLLMEKEHAAAYLKKIYHQLLEHEYMDAAAGLKEYLLHPPQTLAEERNIENLYGIHNPGIISESLVEIPSWCKTIFKA